MTDDDLTMSGGKVRTGGECWLLPSCTPAVPVRVAAAVLIRVYGRVVLLHEMREWNANEVFGDEAEARAYARERALGAEARAKRELELAGRVLAALAEPGES